MSDEPITMRDYVDAQMRYVHQEIERRFETHRQMHEMDTKTFDTFKEELTAWKEHANATREQMTKERSDFVTRKEIVWMLAALGGAITSLLAIIYFVVFAVRGGHPG